MTSTWNDFKQKHILNPIKHRDYESWDKREQNNWLKNRLANYVGNRRQEYGRKNFNSVIIATSEEILEDFKNPRIKSTSQEDFYWSNKKYTIWLFEKKRAEGDERYSITDLKLRNGSMHFLAQTKPRDDGYEPVHYRDQSPTPKSTKL